MKKYFYFIFIFIAVAGILAGAVASAATLTVTAPAITLDTQGESVNAIDLHLSFDPQQFTIVSVSDGGSIIDDWIAVPSFSNTSGTVDLSGIVPGGIVTANGKIISFVIAPKVPGASESFIVRSAQILLNDGQGTAADLSIKNDPFLAAGIPATEGASSTDTLAPDPFTPEIASDPSLFNGAYFLVFGATDQGAGIDHYDVLEAQAGSDPQKLTGWQTAQSPYLLKDQSLGSDIYIRAVDRAGNFRIAEIPAGAAHRSVTRPWANDVLWGILGILMLSTALFLWIKKRKHA